jgi:hypothetical protein
VTKRAATSQHQALVLEVSFNDDNNNINEKKEKPVVEPMPSRR